MTNSLERVTTEYFALEDRLRLSGEMSAGEPEVIWLTQRLTQLLIPALTKWLEQRNGDLLHAEMRHCFAQQAARAGLSPQIPVQPGKLSRTWLASSIGIACSDQHMLVTFKGADGQNADLMLNDHALRQWLSILQDAYIVAGWSLDAWPEWIREGMTPLHSPVAGLH